MTTVTRATIPAGTEACMSHLSAMGSVPVTMTGITGCATAATKLIVTARNLPSSVWLQNATCTATANQAQITLVTARTDVGTSVAVATQFHWIVIP